MTSARASASEPRLRLVSCVGVDLELDLLEHFLEHYASLGIAAQSMHIILNTDDPQSANLREARTIVRRFAAAEPRLWIAPYTSDAMCAQRRALQAEVAATDEWIVNADIDEHHQYPDAPRSIAGYCERHGFNVVQGLLIDRLAANGRLDPVGPERALNAQFPVQAEVALSVIGLGRNHGAGATVKMMLHRADVFPRRGGHNALENDRQARFLAGGPLDRHPRIADPGFRFGFPFVVHHYKWTQRRCRSYQKRLSTPGVSAAGQEFATKMLTHLTDKRGVDLTRAAINAGEYNTIAPWAAAMAQCRRQFLRRRILPVHALASRLRNGVARLGRTFARK